MDMDFVLWLDLHLNFILHFGQISIYFCLPNSQNSLLSLSLVQCLKAFHFQILKTKKGD